MVAEFEETRRRYKPDVIRCLLVAEAPPSEGSGRFFYFEDVSAYDSLFLETIYVLYPHNYINTRLLRIRKREFLERLRDDGFYLIDASETPLNTSSGSIKRKLLRNQLPSLIEKMRDLCTEETKVILISAPVYDVCADRLLDEGFNIINEDMIEFPASSWQPEYRRKLEQLVKKHGLIAESA